MAKGGGWCVCPRGENTVGYKIKVSNKKIKNNLCTQTNFKLLCQIKDRSINYCDLFMHNFC